MPGSVNPKNRISGMTIYHNIKISITKCLILNKNNLKITPSEVIYKYLSKQSINISVFYSDFKRRNDNNILPTFQLCDDTSNTMLLGIQHENPHWHTDVNHFKNPMQC